MRRTITSLLIVLLLLSGCAAPLSDTHEAESGCTALPQGFQEADLAGTWQRRRHPGDKLTLREDGTCVQDYKNGTTGLSFTSECTWDLEPGWNDELYLHVRGMHYCLSSDELCESSGGGGNWPYVDICSGKAMEMRNEVILVVTGAGDDFESVYGHPAPHGILLVHMSPDLDSGTDFLVLKE